MRYILRYRGKGPKPAADTQRIRTLRETKVIDDGPRMLLVEAPEAVLRELMESLPDWVMTAERMMGIPDPHPKLGKPGEPQ